jgi:arylsulfatase A-like enzyme
MNIRRSDSLLYGAANGMETWLWYAAVEYLFSTAAPILTHREKVLNEAQWRGTVVLLVCYAVAGIVTGLLTGLAINVAENLPLEEFNRRHRKVLILLVVAAFGVNLALLPAQPGKAAALLATLLVAAAVIFNPGKSSSAAGLSSSPVLVAGILVFTARLALVNWRSFPAAITIPLNLAATLALVAAAVVAIRLALRVRFSSLWSPVLEHGMIAAATIAIILGPGAVSSMRAEISSPSAFAPDAGKHRPNVILITLDTVRADHMGIYGYARQNTPNLKELVKESTLYTNFIAASTLTLTSHASMFTGLYPQSHGAFRQLPDYPMGRPLPEGNPTMASILGSAGYRSMNVAANFWYLGSEWGLLRGFEYSWTPVPLGLVEANHPYFLKRHIPELLRYQPVMSDFYSSPSVDADTITRQAVSLIDRVGGKQAPFFMFLNYMDAHWPYHSPAPYETTYPGQDEQFTGAEEEAALRTSVDCAGKAVPAGYEKHSESQYDGAIAFMDFKIGELIRHLKENGLFDNTLIMITSDHGEAFGDRGQLGHNVSVYQDQVHIPLVVKYPGSRAPGRADNLASHVDLLPTILEVSGLAPKPDLPGVSLLRLNSTPDRTVLSERHSGACMSPNPRIPGVQYALFRGSSKLISSSLGVRELYNLAKDPQEKTDLYSTAPQASLDSALQDWIRTTPRPHTAQEPVDPERLKHLRSLGYVGR